MPRQQHPRLLGVVRHARRAPGLEVVRRWGSQRMASPCECAIKPGTSCRGDGRREAMTAKALSCPMGAGPASLWRLNGTLYMLKVRTTSNAVLRTDILHAIRRPQGVRAALPQGTVRQLYGLRSPTENLPGFSLRPAPVLPIGRNQHRGRQGQTGRGAQAYCGGGCGPPRGRPQRD